ncbi:hypothetical protein A0H81_01585 [Grifola frondosa]|uniref:Uncharacterized protein n=1 Tax=Grifola frondosa TaxID=5627 RepID=A0A1C7MM22_GRIFR|nr:hypothetical protein A0H81_01585 [Grifola frondosa]
MTATPKANTYNLDTSVLPLPPSSFSRSGSFVSSLSPSLCPLFSAGTRRALSGSIRRPNFTTCSIARVLRAQLSLDMSLADRGRILEGKREIWEAAKQQPRVEKLKASDCRCLAEWSDEWWISSPNMSFVPQVPVHLPDQVFAMGADAMYGAFELFKWPQIYDERYPHGIGAPGNPDLFRNLHLVSFPMEDDVGVLPVFADADAAWWHFTNHEFEVCADIPGAQVGYLRPAAIERLRAAITEQLLDDRLRFILRQTQRLQSALVHLVEIPMSTFDVAQWFREVQRLLLEVRGWLIYTDILAPRLVTPNFHDEEHVLPLRGVFTGRLTVAETLFRCGVPVWWVRPAYTLTTATVIMRIHAVIPPSVHFNLKQQMKHGKHSQQAPTWLQASTFDGLSESIGRQLSRISLSGRPMLHKVAPVWEASAGPELAVSGGDGMDKSLVAVPQGHSVGADAHGSCDAANAPLGANKKSRKKRRKAKSAPGGHPTSSAFVSPPAPAYAVPALGLGLEPAQPGPPQWVPRVCTGWTVALRSLTDLPKPDRSRSHGNDFTTGCVYECTLSRKSQPTTSGKVLMTTLQWRIALEGKYYAIPYRPSIVKPASTPAEIALLPQGPPADPTKQKRTRETEDGVVEAPVKCEEKRRYRRIVDRIDISVRFGVHAHFAPYQPELTVPSWGMFCVTRAVADTDSVLWAEVIWEIALMNFRLELLDVDRDLLPALYAQEDSSAAAARQHELLEIWGIKGFLRPMWMETDSVDELSADDWEVRREAFVRWAHVMQTWPGIDLQWDASTLRDRVEYDRFEAQVISVYCRIFYATRSRLPTVPLARPASLHRHLRGAARLMDITEESLSPDVSRAAHINVQSSAPERVDVSTRSQADAASSAASSAACASPSHDDEATLSRLAATPPILLRPPHSQQPSVFLPQEIGWLDALLLSWGYYDDPKVFVCDFEQDFEQVCGNPAARATWIRGKVAWLAQGDLILDTIEKFLADGGPMHTRYIAPLVDEAALQLERTGMGSTLMEVPSRVADEGERMSDEDDSDSEGEGEGDDGPHADIATTIPSGGSTSSAPKRKSTRQGGRSRTKKGAGWGEVNNLTIDLPSTYPAILLAQPSLRAATALEMKFRKQEADDALDDTRTHLITAFSFKHQRCHVSGQIQNTRAIRKIRRKQQAVGRAADTYRRARRAMIALGLPEDDGRYRALKTTDVVPFVMYTEEEQLGDSRKVPSWIWGDFSFVENQSEGAIKNFLADGEYADFLSQSCLM